MTVQGYLLLGQKVAINNKSTRHGLDFQFLVMGNPQGRVRTMPVMSTLLGEWFVPCPVEFNTSLLRVDGSCLEWYEKQKARELTGFGASLIILHGEMVLYGSGCPRSPIILLIL